MRTPSDPHTPHVSDHVSDHVTDQLHPFIQTILACLALWLAVAGWLFFSHGGYVELYLGVISWFVLLVVAILSAMRLIRRTSRRSDTASTDTAESDTANARAGGFRDWISGSFATMQGQEKSRDASIEILLPLTAAAFGMTAIGIVFDLTLHGSNLL